MYDQRNFLQAQLEHAQRENQRQDQQRERVNRTILEALESLYNRRPSRKNRK